MYANQFAAGRGVKPGSLTLALAMTALPIAGLVLSLKVTQLIKDPGTFIGYRVPDDPPPPPPDVKPETKPEKSAINETPYVPDTPVKTSENETLTKTDPGPAIPPQPEIGTAKVIDPPAPPKPVVIGASYDQRFANALQPPYPSAEIRSGNSGRVVIRVLIGADGRVKQVERVSAASDAFFSAAERQALTKWRFKPATSDGVAIEQWKTMALRFELQEQ